MIYNVALYPNSNPSASVNSTNSLISGFVQATILSQRQPFVPKCVSNGNNFLALKKQQPPRAYRGLLVA